MSRLYSMMLISASQDININIYVIYIYICIYICYINIYTHTENISYDSCDCGHWELIVYLLLINN